MRRIYKRTPEVEFNKIKNTLVNELRDRLKKAVSTMKNLKVGFDMEYDEHLIVNISYDAIPVGEFNFEHISLSYKFGALSTLDHCCGVSEIGCAEVQDDDFYLDDEEGVDGGFLIKEQTELETCLAKLWVLGLSRYGDKACNILTANTREQSKEIAVFQQMKDMGLKITIGPDFVSKQTKAVLTHCIVYNGWYEHIQSNKPEKRGSPTICAR